MYELQKMYPHLERFCDLNWEAVTKEYEEVAIEISFPEYLQEKALLGDCPPYIFEIAYYELASFNAKTSDEPFPHRPGVYLNPTAMFLSLEFDIQKMLEMMNQGTIEVYEKSHVLCLYLGENEKVTTLELDKKSLEILQKMENGPLSSRKVLDSSDQETLSYLINRKLVIEVT
jgi:hypothetical protein